MLKKKKRVYAKYQPCEFGNELSFMWVFRTFKKKLMEYYLIVCKIVISTWTLGKKISDVNYLASCEEHYLELKWMWGFGSCEHSCFYSAGKFYQNISQILTYGSLLRLAWTPPKCPADRRFSRHRLMISARAVPLLRADLMVL